MEPHEYLNDQQIFLWSAFKVIFLAYCGSLVCVFVCWKIQDFFKRWKK